MHEFHNGCDIFMIAFSALERLVYLGYMRMVCRPGIVRSPPHREEAWGSAMGEKQGTLGADQRPPHPAFESYILGKVSLSLLMEERDNCTFLLALSND